MDIEEGPRQILDQVELTLLNKSAWAFKGSIRDKYIVPKSRVLAPMTNIVKIVLAL